MEALSLSQYGLAAFLTPLLLYLIVLMLRFIKWFVEVRRIKAVIDCFAVGEEKPHWFYGHTRIITGPNEESMQQFLKWTAETKTGAFCNDKGLISDLVLCHPKTAKLLLASAEPKGAVPNTGWGYSLLVPWLGDGLLMSRGSKWKKNRKLLTPAFHYDVLKPYVHIYNDSVDKLIQTITLKAGNESVNVVPLISLCTLNIMRKCAFSIQEDIQDPPMSAESHPYVQAVHEMSHKIMERFFNPLLFFDFTYKLTQKGRRFFQLCDYSHHVARDIIGKRRQYLRASSGSESSTGFNMRFRNVDFLDMLLLARDENGKGLTDKEILDEFETFMFEGHDTTASALCWILYNFSRHPEYQRMARDEIDRVFKNKDCGRSTNGKSSVEWEDLSRIPFTTRCIKESMRMHPPVPVLLRELSRPMQIAGKTLLPGSTVEINFYCIHHNPEVWGSNHMDFDPDRFLPDNMAKMDSHAFVPFSAGPRNCIGQNFAMNEIKTTVMKILHEFDLSMDEENKVEMAMSLVLRPLNGIKLYFKPRNY